MTGIDVVLAILIVLQIYIGHKRGFIGEVFDVLSVVGGCAIALHVFIPFGKQINGWTEWPVNACFWFAFLGIFTPVAVGILLFGMHLDRVTRDGEKVPEEVLNYGGAFFAFFKSFFACWLLLMLIKASPLYTASSPTEFRYAPVINFVEATGGKVGLAIYEVIAPERAKNLIGDFFRSGF